MVPKSDHFLFRHLVLFIRFQNVFYPHSSPPSLQLPPSAFSTSASTYLLSFSSSFTNTQFLPPPPLQFLLVLSFFLLHLQLFFLVQSFFHLLLLLLQQLAIQLQRHASFISQAVVLIVAVTLIFQTGELKGVHTSCRVARLVSQSLHTLSYLALAHTKTGK